MKTTQPQPVEHVWSIICSNSTLNADNNNISLHNLIEKLTLPVPAQALKDMASSEKKVAIFPIQFEIVSRFKRNDSTKPLAFDARFQFINPEGKAIFVSKVQKIALKEGVENMRLRSQFTGIPFRDSGQYRISVEIKDVGEEKFSTVHHLPIQIVVENTNSTGKKSSS